MVRNYKRKSNRGEWSKESMKKALQKVLTKEAGYKKTALRYGIPKTTLIRYVKKINNGEEVKINSRQLGPLKTIFNEEEEEELAQYLKNMEERLFGLTTLDLRRLAYQLALKNNKKFNPNTNQETLGD